MFKGKIANEFGEVVGYYWYLDSQYGYCLNWLNTMTRGWTLEGIREWAKKLDYQVWED